jgi:hypothetical protein
VRGVFTPARFSAAYCHAGSLQRGILGQLAGFEVKRPVVIHHPPAVALEPGQHEMGKLRSVAVTPGVGRGAHSIVKDTFRRALIEGHGPFVQEPFLMGQSELLEGGVQRLHPRLVLVQHVDPAHPISPLTTVKMFSYPNVKSKIACFHTLDKGDRSGSESRTIRWTRPVTRPCVGRHPR